ncbi:hypothetical protein [Burkholderia anthina]|uniref:hypothetical protein n=1 Tax=Burkholderia anthina TaxID=179879 RepID=UPI0015899690|nr:hypothetical protein [Burkholderia anthina]
MLKRASSGREKRWLRVVRRAIDTRRRRSTIGKRMSNPARRHVARHCLRPHTGSIAELPFIARDAQLVFPESSEHTSTAWPTERAKPPALHA